MLHHSRRFSGVDVGRVRKEEGDSKGSKAKACAAAQSLEY